MTEHTRSSARVAVLYTGGTLGMVPVDPNDPGSPLTPAPWHALAEAFEDASIPGIEWTVEPLYDASTGQELPPIDSSCVTPVHWSHMAAAIARLHDHVDGIVVLHGTDTMAYTASALSFMIENLAIPVVLTGARKPIGQPYSDALSNFIGSLNAAAANTYACTDLAEVMIGFGKALFKGNRTTKQGPAAPDLFASPNFPELGGIHLQGLMLNGNDELFLPPPKAGLKVQTSLCPDIAHISLFPGINAQHVDAILQLPSVRGAVLSSFGSGNAPEDPALFHALATAIHDLGKPIVNITQCGSGRVDMGRYEAGTGLAKAGLINGADMTREAAITKLMWALARETDPVQIRTLLETNQRGELSPTPIEE